jgi:SAM-dependent methyltransferase
MDLYDDAFLYDLAHGQFATGEIFKFFNDLSIEYGSPVLELACGSGNILIPLAENGIDIFGLDISDKMLRECRRKAANRNVVIHIQKGDIRSFDLDRKFRFIYIAGNSLQHLTTIHDISACFNSVRRHLEEDGKLMIEVFNPYIPLLVREMGKRFAIGSFGDYDLTEDANYDAASQLSDFNWHFRHRPSDREKIISFTMRQFFPQEFDSLFELHGFRIEHKFGSFDRSDFVSGSPAQIVIASPV